MAGIENGPAGARWPTAPDAARMLDYLLGDGRNLAVDRQFADALRVAQAIDPTCRVVYVHNDPISVVHTGQLLADTERMAGLHSDVCEARKVMTGCHDRGLLDSPRQSDC